MNRKPLVFLATVLLITFFACIACSGQAVESAEKTAFMEARRKSEQGDNHTRAAFSFKFGANGETGLQLTHNNWDVLFGNNRDTDAFDVTMVVDDRSRILDLGERTWSDNTSIPPLEPYDEPTREKSARAVVGHMYLVRTKDRDSDHLSIFRVEQLVPGQSVSISWRLLADFLKPR